MPMERHQCIYCGKTTVREIDGIQIDEGIQTDEGCICNLCHSLHYSICYHCKDYCKNENMTNTVDGKVCDACLDDNYTKCYHCAEYYNIDNMHEGSDGNLYCDACFCDLFFICDSCDNTYRRNDVCLDGGDEICNECYNERNYCDDDEDGDTRLAEPVHPKVRKAWKNKKKRKIITFGIELETNSYFEPTQWFKRVNDGSIDGKEYVSSVLPYGKTGESIVNEFCDYAKGEGGEIGTDCGFHLHLGGYRSSFINMKKVWIGYMLMEKIFFSSMPVSRRSNTYCRRFSKDYSLLKIIEKRNIAKLVSYYYSTQLRTKKAHPKDHYNDKRYYFVNFHSWLNNDTVELRLHSATLNGDKVINWLHINKLFLDWLTNTNTTLDDVINMTDKKFYKIVGTELARYIMGRISKFGIDSFEVVNIDKKNR